MPAEGDADGYVKISTLIDPTGAAQGADATVSEVEKITEATEGATHAASELGEGAEKSSTRALAGFRSVHHLIEGLIEVSEGGTAAIGGMAAEGRILTEVFEGMLGPLAPLLLILTTITQVAIPLFTRAIDEHKKKQDEANEAQEKSNEQLDERKQKAVDQTIKRETDALNEQIAAEKSALDYYKTESGYNVQRIKDAEAIADATKKLTIAILEQQKQKELGAATSQSQRDTIDESYRKREAAVDAAGSGDKSRLETAAVQEQLNSAVDERRAAQEQRDNAISAYNDLKQKAARAAASAEDRGAEPDVAGSFDDALTDAKAKDHAARTAYNAGTAANLSPSRLDDLARTVAETTTTVRAIFDAQIAQKQLAADGGTSVKQIDELGDKIENLTNSIAHLTNQRSVLGIDRQADVADQGAKDARAAEDAAKKKAEDDARDRKAQRDTEISTKESQREALGKDDPRVQQLELEIARLKATQIRDDSDTKIKSGEYAAGSPEAKKADAQANEVLSKANRQATDQAAQHQKKSDEADIQAIRTGVEESGNKGALEGLRAVLERNQGNSAKQLQDLITLLNLQTTHNDAVSYQIATLKALIGKQVNQITSGRDNHQS